MTQAPQETELDARGAQGPLASKAIRSAPRVLLADEDEAMRTVLVAALHAAGFRTIEVATAGELLRLVELSQSNGDAGSTVDAIVADVTLAGYSRQALLVHLRRLAPALPIIAMCSFGDEHTHAEVFALGADAVLDKPFDVDRVVVALQILAPPGCPCPV